MNKTIKEIEEFFKEKPYALRMGANTIANRTGYPVELIRMVRNTLRKENKESVSKGLKMPKILILDIETAPMKAYVWSRWKQNIYLEQTISEWFMICWSAKWLNDGVVHFGLLNSEEMFAENDERIVGDLWTLLNEADIVIAHNGKSFDIPKINSKFIIHGFPPPAPYKQIDTKEVAAKQFGFSSNKLDALAGYFHIPHKDKTDFQLWVECMNGNKDALLYMLNYNIKDVQILEQVYLKLRPWIKGHPNLSLYTETDNACPHCGSKNVIPDNKEFAYSATTKYSLVRCQDCGAVSRLTTNLYPKDKRKQLIRSI